MISGFGTHGSSLAGSKRVRTPLKSGEAYLGESSTSCGKGICGNDDTRASFLPDAVACPRCSGEGSIRARSSKKARAQRKRNPSLPPPPPRFAPCPKCSGSGIVMFAAGARTEGTDSRQQQQQLPCPVRPGVSVAIVGGGIGGLALALALQHRHVPSVVYECDGDFSERSQGYGLTMQQAARAVKALGLSGLKPTANGGGVGVDNDNHDDSTAATSVQKFGITSKRHVVHRIDGTVVGQWGMRVWGRPETKTKKEAGRQNAHVARQELRRMLLDRLEPGTVKWGHKMVSYREIGVEGQAENDLSVEMTFSCHGNAETSVSRRATVLVGADGIRSAVRRLKIGDEIRPLRYLDCIVILGIAPNPMGSDLADGETVFQTADGTTRLYAMPFARPGEETAGAADDDEYKGCGEMMWQLSFPMNEDDAKTLSRKGPAALKLESLDRCQGWHDPIPELLRLTPVRLISGYPVYDRELLTAEELRHGSAGRSNSLVSLLGDAAHPMSPFKGQGANQALLDAVLLARGLYKALQAEKGASNSDPQVSLEDALSKFEAEMLTRSAAKVKASADAAKFLHSEVAIAEGNHPRCTAAAKLETLETLETRKVESKEY